MTKLMYPVLYELNIEKNNEEQLFKNAHKGDIDAKNRLVEANMPLVIHLAKKFPNSTIPVEDLAQEGSIGLMKAIDRFDQDKGYKFSTYATWWIYRYFQQAVVKYNNTIYLPARIVEEMNKVNKQRDILLKTLQREPTIEEISKASGVSIEDCRIIEKYNNNLVSLDCFVGDELDTELYKFVSADTNDTEETAINHIMRENCINLLNNSKLSEREVKMIMLRYGFYNNKKYTFAEIGDIFHVTRERVRQIINESIRKIKISSLNQEFEQLYESIVKNR